MTDVIERLVMAMNAHDLDAAVGHARPYGGSQRSTP